MTEGEEHLGGVVINKVSCYGEIMENNEGRKAIGFHSQAGVGDL